MENSFLYSRANQTPQNHSVTLKPVIDSSFIQSWYTKEFTIDRWEKELQMLKHIGINEVILQETANTKIKFAVYPTQMVGYTKATEDTIQNVLEAASIVGIKVRIGLGENGDWWKKGGRDPAWLRDEAKVNKSIFNELNLKYGLHPALSGWYIHHEFSQFAAIFRRSQKNLNTFYKAIATEIKLKSKLSVMISPYYAGKYSWLMSLKAWERLLKTVLVDTNIDIVALQDSIGVGYNSLSNIRKVLEYTKRATDALGIVLFANVETFASSRKGNISADQNRISAQLYSEKEYVQGFVGFSISHYQNKNEVSQVENYNNYMEYYNLNKDR